MVARQVAQILAGLKLVGSAKEKGEFADSLEAFEDFSG